MYFTSVTRYSPEHGRELPYYKLKESFRDAIGRVHTRVMLVPGYLPDLSHEEITQLRHGLTWKMEQSDLIPCQQRLFECDPTVHYGDKVRGYIETFWQRMVDNGKIDAATRKARRLHRTTLRCP